MSFDPPPQTGTVGGTDHSDGKSPCIACSCNTMNIDVLTNNIPADGLKNLLLSTN